MSHDSDSFVKYTPVAVQKTNGKWVVLEFENIELIDLTLFRDEPDRVDDITMGNPEYDNSCEAVAAAWRYYDDNATCSDERYHPRLLVSVIDGFAVKVPDRDNFSSIPWELVMIRVDRETVPMPHALHRCSRYFCVVCKSKRDFIQRHFLFPEENPSASAAAPTPDMS